MCEGLSQVSQECRKTSILWCLYPSWCEVMEASSTGHHEEMTLRAKGGSTLRSCSPLYKILVIYCFRSPQPLCLCSYVTRVSHSHYHGNQLWVGWHQSPRLRLHPPAHSFSWWCWGVMMGRLLELRLITHKGWEGLIPQGKNFPSVHDRRRTDLMSFLPRWIVLRSSYYFYSW